MTSIPKIPIPPPILKINTLSVSQPIKKSKK